VDSKLLESDFEDSIFPLFTDSLGDRDMAGRSSPINIATPSRNGSASPRHHQSSNLTSALQSTTGNEVRPTPALDIGGRNAKGFGGGFGQRFSSNGGMLALDSQVESGAQPISMDTSNWEQPRRESLAGSLVQGMSWGGTSVGSWIRDEYVSNLVRKFILLRARVFPRSPKAFEALLQHTSIFGDGLPGPNLPPGVSSALGQSV